VDLFSATQYLLFLAIVTALVKPLGGYMERVFSEKRTLLDPLCRPVERLIYRLSVVDPDVDMTGKEYATCSYFLDSLERCSYIPFSERSSFFPGSSPSTTRRQ
jgi:K+-transporting ATPase A subunit